jgi:hypothetical protein
LIFSRAAAAIERPLERCEEDSGHFRVIAVSQSIDRHQ